MRAISILNDVLGPVMRGPSSSHTAGSYHLASTARSLFGGQPDAARIAFDPAGSYAACYRTQGSDLAFATGLLGWAITDDRFPHALREAPRAGLDLQFVVEPLDRADHPNTVEMRLQARGGRSMRLRGQSVGGGAVRIVDVDGWPVSLDGACHETLVETTCRDAAPVTAALEEAGDNLAPLLRVEREVRALIVARRGSPLPRPTAERIARLAVVARVLSGAPLAWVKRGRPLFDSAAGLEAVATAEGLTAGRAAARSEARLLGIPEQTVLDEVARRVDIMVTAVRRGLSGDTPPMQLLRPTAARIAHAEQAGRLPGGGLHARAAIRALAAMHVNCSGGVVCAAPTAGSAGVLPAVVATLLEERSASREQIALALLAAGAIGQIVAERSTFAAEVAGCQVEIGAAGAMAAAAVVDFAGGTARQACDAAAIAFQNTMGSVCDLVQGIVEIPCHTRNAAAASAAFVNADLVLGGYENPVPLDETIDAVHSVGLAMPAELRVTSRGGLAMAPSARALPRLNDASARPAEGRSL